MTTLEQMLDDISVNEQNSIRIDGEKILYFDPFHIFTEKHDADILFLTHAHYDHFSPDDIRKVSSGKTVFVAPSSMRDDLGSIGVDPSRVCFCESGMSASFGGLSFTALPAYNRLKPFHPKKNGWLGYLVDFSGVRVYVAGDTDALPENGSVSCDIAFLPIGGKYTMDAKDAASFASQIAPRVVIPVHYGTVVGKPSDFDLFASLVKNVRVERKLFFK